MDEIGSQRRSFLEIGAYEGRSTCWLIKNLPNDGLITSIDPFTNMPDVEQRYLDNIREAVGNTKIIPVLIKSTSLLGLSALIQQKQQFDFIYVDGDHDPATTLTDACMAWDLLRQGGVILFDDYEYPHEPTKRGIDSFLSGFFGKYEPVLSNYQLAVRKK